MMLAVQTRLEIVMAHAEGQTRQAGQTPTTNGSPAREARELLQLLCHVTPVVDGVVVHFVEELHLVANKGSWRLHIVCERYRHPWEDPKLYHGV